MYNDVLLKKVENPMNEIMKKSLSHYNYEASKKKATLEEPVYSSYMPATPIYKKCEGIKITAGCINFLKNLRP